MGELHGLHELVSRLGVKSHREPALRPLAVNFKQRRGQAARRGRGVRRGTHTPRYQSAAAMNVVVFFQLFSSAYIHI